jgi:hypothetical protein
MDEINDLPNVVARSAGNVQNTFLVPAEKVTSEPELLDAITVVRANVVPDAVYVPIPTSHSDPLCPAIV